MNKVLNSASRMVLLFLKGIKRFYVSTCFTIIAFGVLTYLINGEGIGDSVEKIFIRILSVSIIGFLLSALSTLVLEKYNYNTKRFNLINLIISFGVPILYFFFILTDIKDKYQISTLIGINIALALLAVYYSNVEDNEKFSIHASHLVKILFVAAIVAMIVMLGLFLCTAAVYFLIYKFNEGDEILSTIAAFCWIILFVNLFLAMLPKARVDYKIPKFFKIITLYTALPVYSVLILILYIYLGKIAVTQKFPSGQLNWFASFASLIGIFLFITLRQYYRNNVFVKWYIKLFGYLLLPIIAMQCIAYYIRFSHYGLTSARYISLVLIIISIITAILSVIKNGRYIPYVLFLTAFCSILTTTGYFNLHDVPIYEQEARLSRILAKHSMLDSNNKIMQNPELDEEVKIKITSAYEYIVHNGIDKSKLLKEHKDKEESFQELFGFDRVYERNEEFYGKYISYHPQENQLDISGYSNLIDINNLYLYDGHMDLHNNILTIAQGAKKYTFDLNEFIKDLYGEYGSTNIIPLERLVIEQDANKLIINNISFNLDEYDNITINYISGYILEK